MNSKLARFLLIAASVVIVIAGMKAATAILVPFLLAVFIAAVPGVLLAFVQFGFGWASVAAVGYIAVNVEVGNVLEPRLMGRGLGLSPLVVLLSMIFWGWVLGPVEMLLSVPLTMTVKIVLDSREETQWIATLLGSSSAAAGSATADQPAPGPTTGSRDDNRPEAPGP